MLDPGGRAFRAAVGATVAPPRRDVAATDEDELARRAGAGDEEAFAELCRRSPRLHALCRGILRNADDAHDAVQSATEKALAALRSGQPRGDVRPWLTTICRNEALSLLRVRAPWSELDDLRAATGPSPEATVLLRERLAGVAGDLAELPERQRRAIVLREIAELPYDRVARQLGMRQDAARQAVSEARSALREGDEGRAASCEGVRLLLQDGDGRRRRSRRVRSHLRICGGCRAWQLQRGAAPAGLRAFLPGLWAALPGAGSWLPGLPAFLTPGAGGAPVAVVGGARAAVVATVVAIAPGGLPATSSTGRPDDHAAPTAQARAATPSAPAAGGSSGTAGRGRAGVAGTPGGAAAGAAASGGNAAVAGTGGRRTASGSTGAAIRVPGRLADSSRRDAGREPGGASSGPTGAASGRSGPAGRVGGSAGRGAGTTGAAGPAVRGGRSVAGVAGAATGTGGGAGTGSGAGAGAGSAGRAVDAAASRGGGRSRPTTAAEPAGDGASAAHGLVADVDATRTGTASGDADRGPGATSSAGDGTVVPGGGPGR